MSKLINRLKPTYRVLRKKINNGINAVIGDRNYEKYIVIAYARTGSNLFMSYLDSHKNIEAKGELFREPGKRSCSKIWNEFFSKKKKHINRAGFKIFYSHPFHTEDREVWDFISNDKDIKIIHLVRENKLRTFLSQKIAKKTDIWTRKSDRKIPLEEKQIQVDFDELLSRLELNAEYEDKTRKNYPDHQFLEITYEDLVDDKNGTMTKVYDFLHVEPGMFESKHKRQNKESICDLVLNYKEIKDKLNKTKFAYLLDLED